LNLLKLKANDCPLPNLEFPNVDRDLGEKLNSRKLLTWQVFGRELPVDDESLILNGRTFILNGETFILDDESLILNDETFYINDETVSYQR